MARRDLHLGRLSFVSLLDDPKEALGDALDVSGPAVTAGERRARPFPLIVPVYGGADESNPYGRGAMLRRQLRSLLENSRLRQLPVYVKFDVDPDLNQWVLLGEGDLAYAPGGVSMGEFLLSVSTFRVGAFRSHREARQVALYDLRLSTTPRDYLGSILSADFAGVTALAVNVLPVGANDLTGAGRVPVVGITRASLGGNVVFIVGRTHGEVVSYEHSETDLNKADVVVYARPGWTETFDTDLSHYTFDAGSGTFQVTGGKLAPTSTAAKRMLLTTPSLIDAQATVKVNTGATPAGATVGLILKRLDATNYLRCYVSSTTLAISKVDAGAASDLNTVVVTALAANTDYWVRFRQDADNLTAELFTDDPDTAGTLAGTVSYTLLSGNATKFGRGVTGLAGLLAQPADLTARYDNLNVKALLPLAGDPQDTSGWEEIYGTDYQVAKGTVPVIENGFCRVRYTRANGAPAFAVDVYDTTTGAYIERGRAQFYYFTGSTNFLCDTLVQADVVEWSPERAVIRLRLRVAGVFGRLEAYITLQRGWSGPRLEAYPASLTGVNPGAEVRYVPIDTGLQVLSTANTAAFTQPVTPSDDGILTWTSANALLTATDEPRATLVSSTGPACTIVAGRAGDRLRGRDDAAVAYGAGTATRKALAVFATEGVVLGWVAGQLTFGAPSAIFEAETYRNTGSGTTSNAADGAASAGTAIDDTQTAATAATLLTTAAQLDALITGGKIAIYVRVRARNGADTLSVKATIAGVSTATKTTSSTTFVWIYLGELDRNVLNSDTLSVTVWRSAGTASSMRLDRVHLLALERRVVSGGDYLGARDTVQTAMYEAATTPTLVSR